jgi:hypothetical protein
MLPDRETQRLVTYRAAPLDELLAVLLRQFRRLLLAHGLPLSDADAAAIAAALARQDRSDPRMDRLRTALVALVEESEGVLAGMGLTFAHALRAGMDDVQGWETTADFLALAEQKANAELRISAGSSLLVLLGEPHFADHLRAVRDRAAETGQPDLDSVIAERVLQAGHDTQRD